MMLRITIPVALLFLAPLALPISQAEAGNSKGHGVVASTNRGGAAHGIDRRSTVHALPRGNSAPSHSSSRDRYHGNKHSGSHHKYHGRHDDHGHHHTHHASCGHFGHFGHHDYYGSHHYYRPSVSLRYYGPTTHEHYVGCGHVAYYCDRCHFHSTSIQIFSDHVHLAHHVTFSALPALLTWSPVNLTFVFD